MNKQDVDDNKQILLEVSYEYEDQILYIADYFMQKYD